MTEPGALPGGWAPDVSLAGPEWSNATPDQQAAALAMASNVVWALSGRRFGVARVLLAPWVPCTGYLPWQNTPQLAGMVGVMGGNVGRPVPYGGIDRARRILLPGPVTEVRTVTVDGAVLTAGVDYTLEPHTGRLARRAGLWPAQDLDNPIFTVEYVRGTVVPPAANLAAGIYAQEWLKGAAGAAGCRLPARTREVARAGVTASMVAPETMANAGLTGIPDVDTFITAVNPARLLADNNKGYVRQAEPAVIWSPELAAHRILEVGPA